MPTVGTKPSLQSTQLVGALLLHQFARERLPEESRENFDSLVANRIEESGVVAKADISNNNNTHDQTNFSDVSTTLVNDSHFEQNVTTNSDNNHSNIQNESGDCFHSMAESTNGNDNTVYHSMNAGCTSAVNLHKLENSDVMRHYGEQLRRLAEEFARDRKRQEVKDNANKVELKDITKENFVKLLEELFQDKITREKIVVLFFFCTDVALRAASFAQELVVKLMGWSFSYIIDTVCRVVYELGGWDNLLCRQLPSLLVTCCAVLGICALTIYIRKGLRV